jgi:hypothetical protein
MQESERVEEKVKQVQNKRRLERIGRVAYDETVSVKKLKMKGKRTRVSKSDV